MNDQVATRRRYLATVGAVGTAGLAGCSDTLAGELLDSGVDEATRERYIGVATRMAADVEAWHRARRRTARWLALTDVAQNGTSEERQAWLQTEAEQLPEDVYQVHIVDPSDNWTVVASTSGPKVGEVLNTREAPWQNDTLEYGDDGVFTSRAVEALTRSLVSFVTQLGTDGDRRHLLVVQTDVDELASTDSQPTAEVYSQIVNRDGRIVAGTRETDRLDRNDGTLSAYPDGPEAEAVVGALGGESGFVDEPAINDSDEVDGDDGPYVVAYAPVENRAWAVLTHVPKATAKSG